MKDSNFIFNQLFSITKKDRQNLHGHESFVIWFTGLSGSGKSTIANIVEKKLYSLGKSTFILDGDNLRHGLNNDLGFTLEDRKENVRRISECAKILVESGVIVLVTAISPFQKDRELSRGIMNEKEYIEVFVECPLNECEKRDPKGLYKKARLGEISEFTGVSSPYEEPISPEIRINSHNLTPLQCADYIIDYLVKEDYIAINS